MRRCTSTIAPRKGNALVLALIIVIAALAIGGTFLTFALMLSKASEASRSADRTQHIADSALELSRRFLFVYRDKGTWDWDDLLRYNSSFTTDPAVIREDALSLIRSGGAGGRIVATWPEAPVPSDPVNPTILPTFFGVHVLFGDGAWYIVARNNPEEADPFKDTDGRLLLLIFATTSDGFQRVTEACVQYDSGPFTPIGAVMTGGFLRIDGTPEITTYLAAGSADVMSNADVTVRGTSKVDGKVSAAGIVEVIGTPAIRDGTASGVTPALLPRGDPESYRHLADFTFKADGTVEDGTGATIAVGTWKGFTYKKGAWEALPKSPAKPAPSSTIFVETDLTIRGNASYDHTFIAKGDIAINGTATGVAITPAINRVGLLAGGDIDLGGTADIYGSVIAREQVSARGNVTISPGSIIALDEFDFSKKVTSTSSVSGNVLIEYPDGQPTFLGFSAYSLQVVYVRRIR
jgi:hypothetical protein